MSRSVADLVEYQTLLAQSGLLGELATLSPSDTIFEHREQPTSQVTLDGLRVLVGSLADPPELELGERIGQGGMAQVLVAEQLSVGREVAVKCALSAGGERELAAANMLREARVTASLEHPNIVPVHTLGRTHDGQVLLVMKRIEGTVWSSLLEARSEPSQGLEEHIKTLMDVCRAVHFAHSRGVVHRDLKPQNVMVGSFGEVYVLDWGLGAYFGDGPSPGLPHVKSLTRIFGTPQYMAPEMTVPGSAIDARSDVYLLGGILHAIITGQPPHEGATLAEVLGSAFVSEPKRFGDDVPVELAEICNRALARKAQDRYASAEDFRLALAAFLQHASARTLCHDARLRLAEVEELIAHGDDRDLAISRAASAARFGFEHALQTWPESPEARQGLRRLLEQTAEYEIRRGHADAAGILLGEMTDPPERLETQYVALRARLKREAEDKQRLESMARSLDPRLGQRGRAVVFLAGAMVWASFAIVQGYLYRAGRLQASYLEFVAAHAILFVLFPLGFRLLPGKRAPTKASKGFIWDTMSLNASAGLMWVAMWVSDAPRYVGLALGPLYLTIFTVGAAAKVDSRLWPAALVSALAFPLVLLFPEYAHELNGILVALSVCFIAWRWRELGQHTAADR